MRVQIYYKYRRYNYFSNVSLNHILFINIVLSIYTITNQQNDDNYCTPFYKKRVPSIITF